ncbi:hypothetical protein RJ639_036813 [Escallonia herrerae]|uniref:RRM domain-containing protein n=1 Tax=Escallonia herrerae TaxID=1293975 RepID=A0AA88WSX3_9ASTE|nr:hypothetical protein RJ639_036813 [Escallonia herrerae]
MAFVSRIGNILKQAGNKRINSELAASNSFLLQAIRCMSSAKLFIGGLSYGTDETSLREAFSNYGQVVEARVIIDRDSGRSRGFGFVSFASSEEASSALQAMDGQDLHGRRVRVNYATEKPRGGGFAGGYGSGGYNDGGYAGGGGFSGGGGSNDGGYGGAGGRGSYGVGNNYNGGNGSYSGDSYGRGGGRYGGSSSFDGGNSGGYTDGSSNTGNYNVAGTASNYYDGGSGNDTGLPSSGFSETKGAPYGGDEKPYNGTTDMGNEGFGVDSLDGNSGEKNEEPDGYANSRV